MGSGTGRARREKDRSEVDAGICFPPVFRPSSRVPWRLAMRGRFRFLRTSAFGLLRTRGVRHFLSRRRSFHPLLLLSPSLGVRKVRCPVLGPQSGFGGPHRLRLPFAARSRSRFSRRLASSLGTSLFGETGKVSIQAEVFYISSYHSVIPAVFKPESNRDFSMERYRKPVVLWR